MLTARIVYESRSFHVTKVVDDSQTQDAALLLTIKSFLLTVEFFCLQLCFGALLLTVRASLLQMELLYLQLKLFAYSGNVPPIRSSWNPESHSRCNRQELWTS